MNSKEYPMLTEQNAANEANNNAPTLKVFEVTAAGFDEESVAGEALAYWVAAPTREAVKTAIQGHGAEFCGEVPYWIPSDVDFTLPRQRAELAETLMRHAAEQREAHERIGIKPLDAEKFYVLTPAAPGSAQPDSARVLGPFDDHRAAFLARCGWAYDQKTAPERAEILNGEELARGYAGRFGLLDATAR